jgi:CRISPR-associated protein Cas2
MELGTRAVRPSEAEVSALKNWYLVSYDVRDEGRLRKVQRVMLGYGFRLQYSVFRCLLTERDTERMRWELTRAMGEEDELLIARLCEACVGKLTVRSSKGIWPTERQGYRVI